MAMRIKAGRQIVRVLLVMLTVVLPAGCASRNCATLNPGAYPDPPPMHRHEVVSIYIEWNSLGGEYWTQAFSAKGIVEECGPPRRAREENVIAEDEMPGGRTLWFRGLSPGDLVMMFTIRNAKGEIMHIRQYAVRVYEDLKLALLHAESRHFRE